MKFQKKNDKEQIKFMEDVAQLMILASFAGDKMILTLMF